MTKPNAEMHNKALWVICLSASTVAIIGILATGVLIPQTLKGFDKLDETAETQKGIQAEQQSLRRDVISLQQNDALFLEMMILSTG